MEEKNRRRASVVAPVRRSCRQRITLSTIAAISITASTHHGKMPVNKYTIISTNNPSAIHLKISSFIINFSLKTHQPPHQFILSPIKILHRIGIEEVTLAAGRSPAPGSQ